MSDYKNVRYVITPNWLNQELQPPKPMEHLIVLCDIGFWADNYETLVEWVAEHNGIVSGMTVNIPDDETLTLFCLRW